ncbi:glutathione S-transferase family protein [Dongia soli]|uniref:glutathione transferase n=1 Tax=Dongia soli TaxID=600628 RepID=A0ABU5E548_9PROT|nr:glutathione S-transferase family protein [Dongia soli]MDY0881440.1 glutathione S-transferase family protein [Dongia soli]
MSQLRLISHPLCPYVQRVAIALMEKHIPYECDYIDLAEKPAWFSALSPLGKVPLLQLADSTVLFESAVICDYLEEAFPRSLHPDDPASRARERAWIEFGSAVLATIWGLETAQNAETLRCKAEELRMKFDQVEQVLDGGPWFAGSRFGLVDAAFGPVFRYFDVFDTIVDLGIFDGLGKLRRWREHLSQRPSIQQAVVPDYADRLRRFLAGHGAYLHHIAAHNRQKVCS